MQLAWMLQGLAGMMLAPEQQQQQTLAHCLNGVAARWKMQRLYVVRVMLVLGVHVKHDA